MRYTSVLAAALVAPLVAAHGGEIPGAPKIFGLPKNLRRYPPVAHAVRSAAESHEAHQLEARQGGQDGRCGPSFGGASCAAGYCCSGSGYCGTSADHCNAPDCLFQYGPACDANKTPAGSTTRNDARPQKGAVEYGTAIYKCRKAGTVAITYDDGPYSFTNEVLDQFKAAGAKATFFVTGINIGKGAIDEVATWSAMIKRMVAEGHQVASHTWSHQNLDQITEAQIYDQMVKNEMAIRNIIGKYPTYMRPPYSACVGATCLKVMKALGYVVSYFDLDTDDYNQLTTEKIQVAKNNFKNGVDAAKTDQYGNHRLAIGHDIHQLTARDLTAYMLTYLKQTGYTAVTMGECMNDPEANWYRSSTPGGTNPVTTSATRSTAVSSSTRASTGPASSPTGKTSTDGTCGGTGGFSCIGFSGGQCCSQYGWCGASTDHCSTGCQSAFGQCGSSSPVTTSRASTTATSIRSTSTTTRATSTTTRASSTTVRTSASATATRKASVDGTCGGTNAYSCVGFSGGQCCSQYGWCGSSTAHCSTGCNSAFGICG
ncbi:carbohydrate esterase family 4 protein [Dothidotthia symphoricarpi CBS 119687]|uniref:Carbohydrate esterase family 4 protein n=1 Tax=Dothidotthia symphoricarpi CBS 119687 TaxID=1392245 RepID=A0A6A6AKV2_9PLEO|nr:carbohydrate esterase family 4 protein [Dothidotthia symphoricarpi CBS 119687]KAF2131497.1 carbohydrate esterase family 4 protein [Dothidotthia symphoricarpi CBS 119687]